MPKLLAVITGAGTGIGFALAENLVERGYHVFAIGRRDNPLKKLQKKFHDKVQYITADVSTKEGRHAIAHAISEQKIHFLIHNAAIIEPLNDLMAISEKDWGKMMATNVAAPLFLTQALLPNLKGGRILQVSSAAAHRAVQGISAYCISKAALYSIFLNLKQELLKYNIAIGSVDPGVVDTPMQYVVRMNEKYHATSFMWQQSPSQKPLIVSPNVVANFLTWLLCDVESQQYSATEWNIYDKAHHAKWLPSSLKQVCLLPEHDPELKARVEAELNMDTYGKFLMSKL